MQSLPSILVVDDEPAFCDVVCEILQMFGFEAHQALSAGHALEVLETLVPDLILTDIMMPGIDGLSLLRRLRARPSWSGIPTVVVSAMGSDQDMLAAEQAGADGFLAKPFSAEDLRRMVHRFILPQSFA